MTTDNALCVHGKIPADCPACHNESTPQLFVDDALRPLIESMQLQIQTLKRAQQEQERRIRKLEREL